MIRHFTASGIVLSDDLDHVLLAEYRKLGSSGWFLKVTRRIGSRHRSCTWWPGRRADLLFHHLLRPDNLTVHGPARLPLRSRLAHNSEPIDISRNW